MPSFSRSIFGIFISCDYKRGTSFFVGEGSRWDYS